MRRDSFRSRSLFLNSEFFVRSGIASTLSLGEETMSDPSQEKPLDELRSRAEQDPGNLSLRFELGQRLHRIGRFSESVSHLQAATRDPHYRPLVLGLLIQKFDSLGMPVLDEIREMAADSQDPEKPSGEENDA